MAPNLPHAAKRNEQPVLSQLWFGGDFLDDKNDQEYQPSDESCHEDGKNKRPAAKQKQPRKTKKSAPSPRSSASASALAPRAQPRAPAATPLGVAPSATTLPAVTPPAPKYTQTKEKGWTGEFIPASQVPMKDRYLLSLKTLEEHGLLETKEFLQELYKQTSAST